jgi:putative ABC transport system substrate-binding protein
VRSGARARRVVARRVVAADSGSRVKGGSGWSLSCFSPHGAFSTIGGDVVNRRQFLSLTAAMLAAPLAGAAQQAPVRRIGIISAAPRTPVTESFWEALRSGLHDHGWVESRNIVIERRDIELRKDVALSTVDELIRRGVEVIVVASTLTALAAKQATRKVPIVMTVPSDPVAVGLVDSLARPGGNVTGLSFVGTEVAGKQVELLRDVLPELSSIGVLTNPTNPSHAPRAKEITRVGQAMRLQVNVVEASSRDSVSEAFREIVRRGVGAGLVLADALFVREASSLIRLAAEHRLPVMYGLREAPLAGGLMSYGPNFGTLFRRAASYVDKILKGANPRDLPVEQASTFELVLNLRTARALGLTIPRSLLLRADQVIE